MSVIIIEVRARNSLIMERAWRDVTGLSKATLLHEI